MGTHTKTERILVILHIIAWIAFIGYIIEAGSLLISYAVSWLNPAASKDLYKGWDLSSLREVNFWYYTQSVSFVVALSLMKAFIWYLVIKTLSKIKLVNPFVMEIALTIEKISYILFGTWLVSIIASGHSKWLMKSFESVDIIDSSGEYLFMAGLMFIISQVFKRGVEIQAENELTV